MVARNKVDKASAQVHALDEETQALLASVKSKNNKAIVWFIVSWTILFLLSCVGIYYQNRLATQNKNHIDCIIKDLETPLPQGSRTKYIANLGNDCNIKFQ